MIIVQCDTHAERRYYSLSEAARLITKNQWGVPVLGIHSETLRRARRDNEQGIVIGRDVFLTEEDIEDLGYSIGDDASIKNIIKLEVN